MRDKTTAILSTAGEGDRLGGEAMLGAVYAELRGLAAGFLRRERVDHTLQPTALVHEAYLRLVRQGGVAWESKEHFLAVAAIVMRRVLVDHAKERNRLKRGGGRGRVSLDLSGVDVAGQGDAGDESDVDLVALDAALERLAAMDERQATVVELRYFGGLTAEETARVLGVSVRTVHREWTSARAWLRREIERGE